MPVTNDFITRAWCALVFRRHTGIPRVNGKSVLIGDGIEVAKSGRQMPGVKKLHQPSESNTRPEHIFGHSCQATACWPKPCPAYSPSRFDELREGDRAERRLEPHPKPGFLQNSMRTPMRNPRAPAGSSGLEAPDTVELPPTPPITPFVAAALMLIEGSL